jgi:hypothetical protein
LFVGAPADCETACIANPSCTGYEYNAPPLQNPGKCELHTAAGDFHHTAAIAGCTCFAKTQAAQAQAATLLRYEVSGHHSGGGASDISSSAPGVAIITLFVLVSMAVALGAAKRVMSSRRASETSQPAADVDVGEWDDSWVVAPTPSE